MRRTAARSVPAEVDPVSLTPLPGYDPIDFNRHYDYVASRDGRTLAAMLHPDDSPGNPGWQLRVIDVPSWTDYLVDLDLDERARGLTFSLDGTTLYWAESPRANLARNATDDHGLYGQAVEGSGLYVLDANSLEEAAHLNPGTAFFLNGFSPDGRYAYVSRPVEPDQLYWIKSLQVVDLGVNQVVAEMDNTMSWLLPLATLQR